MDKVDRDLDGANISPDRLNVAASYVNGPLSARIQTQFFLARQFERAPGNYNPLCRFDGYDVTDLFDTFYIDYYSQTVRPNDNARYFAGRGRNFTLSCDYRF